MRQAAGLEVQEFGVPIDVLWFRISRRAGDPEQVLGNINYGKALILINRGDYFQAGLIIPQRLFRANQARRAGRVSRRLSRGSRRTWASASASSRAGIRSSCSRCRSTGYGSGIFRDCCASAMPRMPCRRRAEWESIWRSRMRWRRRICWPSRLRQGRVTEALLARVQQRREFPARVTQMMQVNAHKMFERVFQTGDRPLKAPWQLKAVAQVPGLQRVMGHVVGMGVRPEHVAGPARYQRRPEWSSKRPPYTPERCWAQPLPRYGPGGAARSSLSGSSSASTLRNSPVRPWSTTGLDAPAPNRRIVSTA